MMIVAFNLTNVLAVFFLIFLEGALSLDNALALALMVKHLPEQQQKRALTWGIWSAFAFRFIALFFLAQIMKLFWIKILGAIYLFAIAIKGITQEDDPKQNAVAAAGIFGFWGTIAAVEIVDIAFSADSILAAVSLTQSYWIVLLGGLIGIVMMRFAAILFVGLIRSFPRLATTAYVLVFVIACKLMMEAIVGGCDFHSSKSPEAWAFWLCMGISLWWGFSRKRQIFSVK